MGFTATELVNAAVEAAADATALLSCSTDDRFVGEVVGELLTRLDHSDTPQDRTGTDDTRGSALTLIDNAERANQLFEHLGRDGIGALIDPRQPLPTNPEDGDAQRLAIYRLAALDHVLADPDAAGRNAGLLLGSAGALDRSDDQRLLLAEIAVANLQPLLGDSQGVHLFGGPQGVTLNADQVQTAFDAIARSDTAVNIMLTGLFQFLIQQTEQSINDFADLELFLATDRHGRLQDFLVETNGELSAAVVAGQPAETAELLGQISRALVQAAAPATTSASSIAVGYTHGDVEASADRRSGAASLALQSGFADTEPGAFVPGVSRTELTGSETAPDGENARQNSLRVHAEEQRRGEVIRAVLNAAAEVIERQQEAFIQAQARTGN